MRYFSICGLLFLCSSLTGCCLRRPLEDGLDSSCTTGACAPRTASAQAPKQETTKAVQTDIALRLNTGVEIQQLHFDEKDLAAAAKKMADQVAAAQAAPNCAGPASARAPAPTIEIPAKLGIVFRHQLDTSQISSAGLIQKPKQPCALPPAAVKNDPNCQAPAAAKCSPAPAHCNAPAAQAAPAPKSHTAEPAPAPPEANNALFPATDHREIR